MDVSYKKALAIRVFLSLILIFSFSLAYSQDYVEGEIIIKTKSKISSIGGVSKGFFGKMSQKGLTLKGTFGKMQMHLLKVSPGQNLKETIAELAEDPDIEFAEPNYILRKIEDEITNTKRLEALSYEQMLSSVTNLSHGGYSQSRLAVGVDEAWSEMSSASSITPIVAVIDTGIDYNHPVLTQSEAIWNNPHEIPNNGVDDDGNGYVDDVRGWNFYSNHRQPWDDEGHGTHVSGIVVGLLMDIFDSSIPLSQVKVMPLKFLGADGSGDTSDAIRAIDYAITNGAQIINASWGGNTYSRSLHEAFSRAYAQGIFIVTAAGNAGSNNDSSPIYPSSLSMPGLISVAACNSFDRLASFSNFGVQSVHIAAPGVTIGSLYPSSQYGYSSGTSMAAPFIAGVGALLLRESPHLTGYQLKELILNSAHASEAYSQKIYTSGRVNVLAALRAAKNIAGVQGFLPSYNLTIPDRAVAAENSGSSSGGSGGGGAGCGTVQVLKSFIGNGGNPSGPRGSSALPVFILMMLPLVLWVLLRNQSRQDSGVEVSSFDIRFSTRVEVSDSVLVKTRQGQFEARLKNISNGGLAFTFSGKRVDVDEQVSFIFSSKDGKEQVEVAGRIVWTDDRTVAGVQFHELNRYIKSFLLRSYA